MGTADVGNILALVDAFQMTIVTLKHDSRCLQKRNIIFIVIQVDKYEQHPEH